MVGCSTNRNPTPNPNCPDGFHKAKNNVGEDCCYKTRKATNPKPKTNNKGKKTSPKKEEIEEESLQIVPNVSSSQKELDEHRFKNTRTNHDITPKQWILPNQSTLEGRW